MPIVTMTLTKNNNNINNNNPQEIKDQKTQSDQDSLIAELKNKLALCEKERDEFKEGWQRERANFENFQKNLQKIFQEEGRLIQQKILSDILEVADSFYLALSQIPAEKKDNPFVTGIYHIKARLDDFLKKNGVSQFGKENEIFDPSLHEAIATEKTDNKENDNKIVKVVSLGFKLNEIVIRPAKVIIAKYQD